MSLDEVLANPNTYGGSTFIH